jgi:hypothetical protein
LVGSIWLDQIIKVYQIDICYFVANPSQDGGRGIR